MRNAAGSEPEWRENKGSLFLMTVFGSLLSFRFIILVHDIYVELGLMLILDNDCFQY